MNRFIQDELDAFTYDPSSVAGYYDEPASYKPSLLVMEPEEPRWQSDSAGLDCETIPLIPPLANDPPVIYFTHKAWGKQQYLIQKVTTEVKWWGVTTRLDDGYRVDDIFVPNQKVNGATCECTSDDMLQLYMEVLEAGHNPDNMNYEAHSHVNMGVTASSQDQTDVHDKLESMPVIIRAIWNKQMRAKIDVFSTEDRVVYCNTEYNVIAGRALRSLDQELRDKVKPLSKVTKNRRKK